MQKLKKYLLLSLLLTALSPLALRAQSDSQTLHSPHASLVGIADFDFGLPMGKGGAYPLSLGGNLIAGFQMNRLFTVGLGVGLHGYGPSDMLLLPVFVDGRMHFPQKKWTPYIALDLGYALSLHPTERGGLLINPAVGGRFPLTDKTALGFSLGIRVQQNQAKVNEVFEESLANYLSLKVGLVVKVPRLSRKVFSKTISRRMKDKEKH